MIRYDEIVLYRRWNVPRSCSDRIALDVVGNEAREVVDRVSVGDLVVEIE